MSDALEALDRLQVGNRRFVEGRLTHAPLSRPPEDGSVQEQRPVAVVVGCSDARVPAELVFDQGVGDLFVIRVAGNVVAPSQIGSVEFAAERFGTRLVVVLGHTHCGAVEATLEELRRPSEHRSPNLHAIVNRIQPAVEGLLTGDLSDDPDALMHAAVRANIASSVTQLKHGSDILEGMVREGTLLVVGAEYSLATGLVEFFEGV